MSVATSSWSTESALLEPTGTIDIPGFTACAILIASLGFLFELPGIAIGFAVTATWLALGTPYAIAVGHVLLAVIVEPSLTLETLALIEVGFVALIVSPFLRAPSPLRFILATVFAIAILSGVVWIAYETVALWLAALLVLATLSVLVYGLHRLSLVQLGRVPEVRST